MKLAHRIGSYFCLLGITIFVLDGCGTSYEVTPPPGRGDYSYNDLNTEFLEKEVVIELNDGREMHARQIHVIADSLSWNESLTGAHYTVAVSDLKRISRRNHLLGGLEGLGFGVLVDVAALVAISSASSREFPIGGFFVLMGVPPVVAGLGAVMGHRYEYNFPVDSTNAKQK
ncbi:MAG: hypothetical protein KF749_01515 [Bacteroidetes bacterium]|nr:hypothetical protein [Bacteroidota bacterium]MCW5896192.1 hypothetical protein [Bacteroidota bacterium]